VRRWERVVFKSMSGVRSIVQLVQPEDLARLESFRWCPVEEGAGIHGGESKTSRELVERQQRNDACQTKGRHAGYIARAIAPPGG
jgi:hypothetical protein